jgi:hypothetical protein
MADGHSRPTPAGRVFWSTATLWKAAEGLPSRLVPITDIAEFEQDCWFGGKHVPSCRAVAQHARQIIEADLSYPVILSADGGLMDGGHRIAKAWIAGQTEIAAVRFEVDPPPDYLIPESPTS